MQLLVTAKKLNKRSSIPADLSDKTSIVGTVLKGFRFEGEEVANTANPSTGKWYTDRDGYCYWGGGLIIEHTDAPTPAGAFSKFPGLPLNVPQGAALGCDMSHYNDSPDWKAIVAANMSFVYIKISEGVGTPDHKAADHTKNAKDNGLQVGYYHFCRPDIRNGGTAQNDAAAEAGNALDIQATLKPDLPLVLDLENEASWDTPLQRPDYEMWIDTFIKCVFNKTGVQPIIYSRKEYLDRKLPATHKLGGYKLWIANYSGHDCNAVDCPVGWNDWYMWQFTESAAVGGNAKLDVNIKKS